MISFWKIRSLILRIHAFNCFNLTSSSTVKTIAKMFIMPFLFFEANKSASFRKLYPTLSHFKLIAVEILFLVLRMF